MNTPSPASTPPSGRAELRSNKIDYLVSTAPSSTEQRTYIGATWDASAATTGIVKVGQLRKDFEDSARKDFTGFSWEATIRWKPTRLSVVDIETSRTTSDPNGLGNYVVNSGLDAVWQHKWTGYVKSTVLVGTLESKYDGVNRTDDTRNYGLGLSYDVLRWLTIGVDWRHTDRGSSDSTYDFKRNVLMATFEATL